jgi:uncharacterized protein (DUF1015 family)
MVKTAGGCFVKSAGMAEILPFRAWRYNTELAAEMEHITSPLFDVVSEKQRNKLYQNPFNSIHLSVPSGPDPARSAKLLLEIWKKSGILVQDDLPGIYVYYQYFFLPGEKAEVCRKGFICHIKTHEFEDRVILRHENTIPSAVNDRVNLLDQTRLHASATHGLYTDPEKELETYMDESMKSPIYETEDYQGVRDVLSVIHDMKIIRRFMELLSSKQVILADGHHRYESSLELQRQMRRENPEFTGNEEWNYHLMYLTNTENDGFRILPTHRLVKGLEHFDTETFLNQLSAFFLIKPVDDPQYLPEVIHGKSWAFGLVFQDGAYKIRLKPELISQIDWKFPDLVKELDLTVMHYFIFEKILGIAGKDQRHSEKIGFERNFANCLTAVMKSEADFAIITNEITMDQVLRVCQSGFTLPQKSTYFYPKVICGFLFSSIEPNEFTFQTDPCLEVPSA